MRFKTFIIFAIFFTIISAILGPNGSLGALLGIIFFNLLKLINF